MKKALPFIIVIGLFLIAGTIWLMYKNRKEQPVPGGIAQAEGINGSGYTPTIQPLTPTLGGSSGGFISTGEHAVCLCEGEPRIQQLVAQYNVANPITKPALKNQIQQECSCIKL